MRSPFRKEGWPAYLATGLPSIIAGGSYLSFGLPWLLWIDLCCLAAFALTLFFFRDPDRMPDLAGPGVLLSPADGTVLAVRKRRINIFLSVLNVHVQRAPAAGRVSSVEYRPGKFLMAFDPAAEHANERNSVALTCGRHQVVIHQVAGAIARRIICFVKKGSSLDSGERFGLICFGSQVDLDVPAGTVMYVKKGDRVRAGQTVIARLPYRPLNRGLKP